MTTSDIKRFWSKIRKTRGCWWWTASTNPSGYGQLRFGKELKSAHRISYELTNGKIPKGLFVLHKCDNPSCVRPDHLFLGTPADNMRDMINKHRGNKPFGENHYFAKISEKDVIEIKRKYSLGNISTRKLATQYNIGKSQIHAIIVGKKWKHV